MIGSVVPAGIKTARWMYVTKIEGDMVHGRMWSARKQQWTKTTAWYGRSALFNKQPNCPKPNKPN